MSALIEFIAVAVIGKVLVPAGAKLLREVINGTGQLPRSGAGNVQKDPSLVPLNVVPGVKTLRSRMASAVKAPSGDLTVMKRDMLETLASTPLYAAGSEQLVSRVEALRNATTIEDVKTAGFALADAVLYGHQKLVTSGVQTAVKNAAVKMGFGNIEALHSPLGNNIIRLAATDAIGRSIVTEIDARPERDLKIQAEVVGVTDNSCQQILDEFYTSLQDEGVEMSAPPTRKPTGGICELAATKAFLAKKLKPTRTRTATAANAHESNDDRRVRINRVGASQTKAKLTS